MKIFSALSGNSLSLQSKGGGIVLRDTGNGNINIVPGNNAKFQVTGSTGFNLIWDGTNQRLNVGTANVTTGGTNTYTFGDHNQNKGNFGSAMFGEYSYIDENVGAGFAAGESVWVRAYGGKAWGRGTRVNSGGVFGFVGGMYLPNSTDPKTNNKVPQVGGNGAFGYYNTDGNQIDNHGALAQGSVILGGLNHNIPSNSINSVILGGDRIKATSATTNTVFLPKLRIGLGQNATIVTGSTSPDVLVRNQTTGEVEITKINVPVVADNNFVFGTGSGVAAKGSLYTGNNNVLVVMSQLPPTINGGTNINNTFILGEGMTLNGAPTNGGTITDSGAFGFGHTIGDNNSFFSGSATFTYGSYNQNYGNDSLAGGKNARVISNNIPAGGLFENGAIAIGLSTQISGSEPVTAYRNSINISSNSTGQTTGHGAYASLSAILGGQDHNIPQGSNNSVIIGGDGIKASSATTNTVYVPKLRIGVGRNAQLVENSLSNDVVVRNPLTGELELREASSIGGGGGGSSAIYSGASPSTVTVGGLAAGTVLTGRTIEQIIQEMLVPTLNPTLTNPSITSFSQNLATTQEVGVSVTPTFTTNFSRGSINPAYGTSGFRSGAPTKYVFSGSGNVRQVNTTSTSNTSAATGSTTLLAGANTWGVYVAYGQGEQPKNSSGGNFSSPLPSGATAVAQTTITGIYPYFYGKVASGGAPAGGNRPVANNALVTGGTKVVASSNGTLNITFNATSDDYIWFAIPSTSTSKTVWYVNALNNGAIGGAVSPGGNLFPAFNSVNVTTVLWAGISYKVYISNYQSATSGVMELRNS